MAYEALSLSTLSQMEDYDPNSMPVEQAQQLIRQFLHPVTETEEIDILHAFQRTLAEDVRSPLNVPPHDYSSMDGYAVRHEDLATGGIALKKVGTAFAGNAYTGSMGKRECVRIMTGAMIPQGADAVVMQEHVRVDGDSIVFANPAKKMQNIRLMGEDIRQDAVVLVKGKRIGPAEMGLLASLGFAKVRVMRKLRVAIFSTGDELVQPGHALGSGQIYDSNRYSLTGLLTELGADVLDMGAIRDEKETLRAAFHAAAEKADVIITSGGASVGDADYVKQLLDEIGEVVFWKIAMKPGKPLAYGKIGKAHFFGLPGNPVSAMVTFQQFVRNALWVVMGQEAKQVFTFKARLANQIKKAPGRTEFQRGILSQDAEGSWEVKTTGDQGSGILSSMSRANSYIILPTGQGNVEPGAKVDVQLF